MEEAKKFLRELQTSEQGKKLLQAKGKPQNAEEGAAFFAEAAETLGYHLSAEDIEAAVEELKREQLARSDAAEKEIRELDPEELEKVAGGMIDVCLIFYWDIWGDIL